jgi:hypothetical protein
MNFSRHHFLAKLTRSNPSAPTTDVCDTKLNPRRIANRISAAILAIESDR